MQEDAHATFCVCPCMSYCAPLPHPAACAGSHANPGAEGTWSKAWLMLRGETLKMQAGAGRERDAK